jgi:hypothetical protein
MTPPRLVQLKCPNCAAIHWTVDSDYRGTDGIYIDYSERAYQCPGCRYSGTGYNDLQKSPPEFFLQPHPMYPMSQKNFDYWADILKSHVPDHPIIERLGKDFSPNTQVFLTKLRNSWLEWKLRARRKVIVLRVDVEDWLDKRLPKKADDRPGDRKLKLSRCIIEDPDLVNIFVSYSHFPNDSNIVFKLVDYLSKRLDKMRKSAEIIADQEVSVLRTAVNINCIRKVTTGDRWQDEFDEIMFLSANFIILMVSPDYLASDYCRRQMNRAEERQQKGSAKVIPVLLYPVEWHPPAFWELLPRNGNPVTNWPNHNEAFADIAEGILQVIPAELQKKWMI